MKIKWTFTWISREVISSGIYIKILREFHSTRISHELRMKLHVEFTCNFFPWGTIGCVLGSGRETKSTRNLGLFIHYVKGKIAFFGKRDTQDYDSRLPWFLKWPKKYMFTIWVYLPSPPPWKNIDSLFHNLRRQHH